MNHLKDSALVILKVCNTSQVIENLFDEVL